jgi:hypothetical protein
MLMRRSEGPGPGAYRRGQRPSGQGFFNAPWWRLLLWIVIFVVALFLVGELGIV